jgi:hypothetical protein
MIIEGLQARPGLLVASVSVAVPVNVRFGSQADMAMQVRLVC